MLGLGEFPTGDDWSRGILDNPFAFILVSFNLNCSDMLTAVAPITATKLWPEEAPLFVVPR